MEQRPRAAAGAEGIAVFDVRPGIIRTDMTAGVAEATTARSPDGLVPARRWGERRTSAASWPPWPAASFGFATGSVIDVDGGLADPAAVTR